MSKIKNLPLEELPREKLIRYGAENLTDSELLALILRVGNKKENVIELSRSIISKYGLNKLSRVTINELKSFDGIDIAKSCQIIACFELSRRLFSSRTIKKKVTNSKDIYDLLSSSMKNLPKEVFFGIYLNSRNEILSEEKISIGTTDFSMLHPRDVLSSAITQNSVSFILCHNHPSGNPEPSNNDIILTKKLNNAAKVIGIKFLDHIIIGDNKFYSFSENGLLKNSI